MFDLFFPKHWSTLKTLIWLKAAALSSAVEKTVSGAILSIKDALAMPAIALSVDIDPVQSGTGDPAPDNVRPITGWTGANVTRTGKNILDPTLLVTQASWKQIELNVPPSTQFVMSTNMPSDNGLLCYFKSTTGGGGADISKVTSSNSPVVTSTAGGKVYITCRRASGTDSFSNYNFQIEVGSTKTDFAAYTGTTIPITFPDSAGTVYGGSLDVTNGVLTVTWAAADVPNLSWSYNTSYAYPHWIATLMGSDRSSAITLLCSRYKAIANKAYSTFRSNDYDKQICVINNQTNPRVAFQDSSITTQEQFDAIKNDLQIIYQLETPVTYQLTPQEVTMLLGNNTLWADTGDSTLTYMADGNADDLQALNILLGGRYVNNHGADEATDAEALNILLGR